MKIFEFLVAVTLAISWWVLGVAVGQQGQQRLAEVEQRLMEDPHNLADLTLRGEILLDLGRVEEAIATMDVAVQAHPDSPEALLFRGALKNLNADREGAKSDEAAALALRSETKDARLEHMEEILKPKTGAKDYFDSGVFRMGIADYKGAIKDFDRYLELVEQPENTLVFMYKAQAEQHIGALADSLETVERGLAFAEGEWPQGLKIKAEILTALGKVDEAKRAELRRLRKQLGKTEGYIKSKRAALENTNRPEIFQRELAILENRKDNILRKIEELDIVGEQSIEVEPATPEDRDNVSGEVGSDSEQVSQKHRSYICVTVCGISASLLLGAALWSRNRIRRK